LYASHLDDARAEQEALVIALEAAIDHVEILRTQRPPDLSALAWPLVKPRYEALLEELTGLHGGWPSRSHMTGHTPYLNP
jgi:hypothetical protein